jgi:polyphenol oxidase
MGLHPDWLIPKWSAPARVNAVFSTRAGGVSVAPYDSFNLGDHVGDDATSVQNNRDELKRRIGARPVFLKQVHGCDVLQIDSSAPDGLTADAAVAVTPGVACTIMVADCLPILFTDSDGGCVAALHAGWRGLADGVVTATVSAMREHTSHEIMAWLGPCIGPQAFEVGEDVKQAFGRAPWASGAKGDGCFLEQSKLGLPNKYLANLPGLARLALGACGVTQVHGNDGSRDWCTVSNSSRFFSHRRDAAARGGDIRSTGRMAALVWFD